LVIYDFLGLKLWYIIVYIINTHLKLQEQNIISIGIRQNKDKFLKLAELISPY